MLGLRKSLEIREDFAMAFVRCSECNKKISDQAVSCPKCGCPVSKQQSPNSGRIKPCPYCGNNTPEEPQCRHCKKPIDTTRVEVEYVGMMPKTTWAKPVASNSKSPESVSKKPEKKPKVPWFAVGMAANQLRDAKIKADKKEREQAKQTSMMDAFMKEMKKK